MLSKNGNRRQAFKDVQQTCLRAAAYRATYGSPIEHIEREQCRRNGVSWAVYQAWRRRQK